MKWGQESDSNED